MNNVNCVIPGRAFVISTEGRNLQTCADPKDFSVGRNDLLRNDTGRVVISNPCRGEKSSDASRVVGFPGQKVSK